jgi:eukaryotic-like serine/threonine-protein kinase
MAEILLAKATGPGGFERLVVIKRLLSHLKDDPTYVQMFLDEARIVARIRHRNVVQVHDLYEIDGEYWLVMEFLEGESATRLFSSLGRSDPALAAYVVSEAASGLRAAHELVTPDGRPSNVVHRDISPQNIFVTYGGDVKLLDFGIARADDRSLRTESGILKGKLEYMAPEQLSAGVVDQRTDLFALGVVLYELSTGIRLFKRKGEVEVIQAICYLPIARPTELVPNYPPELETICMRALERDPAARYQTAAELSKDLAVMLARLEPVTAVRDRLGLTMGTAFPDRTAAKRALATSDPGTELMAFAGAFGADAISVPASPSHTGTRPSTSHKAARWWIPVAAIALVVLLAGIALAAVVGWLVLAPNERETQRSPVASGSTPEDDPAPTVVEAPPAIEAPAEPPPAIVPEADEPIAPAAERVELEIHTRPLGATVSEPTGTSCRSPCTLTVARSSDPITITARAPGRLAQQRVTPESSHRVDLVLVRRAEPVTETAPPPPATMDSPFEAFD